MRILILLLVAIGANSLLANEIHIANQPDKVVVFRKGAEVTFLFKANLKKGVNTVIIDSMPDGLEAEKINISEKTGLPISSIFYLEEKRKVNLTPDEKKIQQIKDSIEVKNEVSLKIESKILVLEEEANIIKNFKLGQENLKAEDLIALTNFYNKRIGEIRLELIAKRKENSKIQNEIELLKEKWSILSNGNSVVNKSNLKQFKFNVFVNENTSTDFKLVYFDNKASWKPYYEVRVKDINSPISFSLKASVSQSTGFNWENVKLELSSKEPNQNNSIPTLSPMYIEWKPSYDRGRSSSYESQNNALADVSRDDRKEKEIEDFPKITVANSTIENQTLNTSYKLNNKATINTNDDEQSFQLIDIEVPASYEYYVVPKKDPNAYLIAKIADYGTYNLINGEAKVYFEGAFVGNSFISSNSIDDTLSIPLGRDEEIQIRKEHLKEFSKSKFLSSKVEMSFGNKISIKNNKKKNIKITIKDQIPVRKFDRVEVVVEDLSGASLEEQTGFLTWKLDLDKNEKKELIIKYKVTATSNAIVPR